MEQKNVREWKSNSFSLLMKEKEYALETFNALNGTDYQNPDEVEIIEIDGGYSITVRNDAMFIVDWALNLYEQQSTINENMPLRFLIYVATFFKQYTNNKNIYRKRLIKLPTPQFICFYNGKEDYPEETILKLSDAFFGEKAKLKLELECKVININEGYNEGLKEKCKGLKGYMTYVDRVNNNTITMDKELAIEKAIDSCIEDNILAEFFRRKKHMILTADALDYTYERRIELERRDAREEGKAEGIQFVIKRALLKGHSPEMVAEFNDVPIEEVLRIQKNMDKSTQI